VAGIYLHIPFCRQACRYCDFFFAVSLKYRDPFCAALKQELKLRSSRWKGISMRSLYLGGGTPSVLTISQLEQLLLTVREHYCLDSLAELTLECNPDDVSAGQLEKWRELGFNRLSIGIQSFHEADLELLRRSHSAVQAGEAVHAARSKGFDNISVDLIYGIPGQSVEQWKENLERVVELEVDHLSAYHLSFESGTVFDHWRKKQRIVPVEDQVSEVLYRELCGTLDRGGFEHYEISNFAREGKRSEHNQIYWSGEAYPGFGPSAHSYDGTSRSWNPSDLKLYMELAGEGKAMAEGEEPGPTEAYHDYLITSLRTSRGADPRLILQRFGPTVFRHFQEASGPFIEKGQMKKEGDRLRIAAAYWLMADYVLRDLFMD